MNPECEEQVRLETVRERIMVTNSASELGKSFSHSSYLLPNKIVICFAVRIRCASVILSELFDPVHLVLFKSEEIIRLICKFKHAYHTSEHPQLRRKINPNIFDKKYFYCREKDDGRCDIRVYGANDAIVQRTPSSFW